MPVSLQNTEFDAGFNLFLQQTDTDSLFPEREEVAGC